MEQMGGVDDEIDLMTDGVVMLSWWKRLRLRWWAWRDRRKKEKRSAGAWGECWAERFLRVQGCRIIARNVRPFRRGEVDIIALQGKTILFVEVKTRRSQAFGRPLQAVNRTKRQLLRKSATHWLSQHHLLRTETIYRFDAVEVIGEPHGGIPKMNWVRRLNMDEAPATNACF